MGIIQAVNGFFKLLRDFFFVNFPHLTANVKKNRFALLRNRIAKKRQHRQLVEIHNTDKVIIVQYIHRLLPTTAGKRIENTVGHQFPEADADVIFVQFFQKRIRHLIGQTIHRFIQIVGGQLLCQFHQGSIHAVCLG